MTPIIPFEVGSLVTVKSEHHKEWENSYKNPQHHYKVLSVKPGHATKYAYQLEGPHGQDKDVFFIREWFEQVEHKFYVGQCVFVPIDKREKWTDAGNLSPHLTYIITGQDELGAYPDKRFFYSIKNYGAYVTSHGRHDKYLFREDWFQAVDSNVAKKAANPISNPILGYDLPFTLNKTAVSVPKPVQAYKDSGKLYVHVCLWCNEPIRKRQDGEFKGHWEHVVPQDSYPYNVDNRWVCRTANTKDQYPHLAALNKDFNLNMLSTWEPEQETEPAVHNPTGRKFKF